jgi:protein SCO1/2
MARFWPVVGLVSLLAIVAGTFVVQMPAQRVLTETRTNPIGGPFQLVGGNSQILTDRDFRGKWLLIYFGYTHCPDICPTTLAEISETLKLLGPLAANTQPIFITIDPARDSPEVVGAYVGNFDERIIGLSGSPTEIADVAHAYKVYYSRSSASSADQNSYFMEHTAFVYVVGPDGKYVTLLSPTQGQTPENMAARLKDLIGSVGAK